MDLMVIEGQCGREKAVSEAEDGVVLGWFVTVRVVSADCRLTSSFSPCMEHSASASLFGVVHVPTVDASGDSCCVVVLSSKTFFVLISS